MTVKLRSRKNIPLEAEIISVVTFSNEAGNPITDRISKSPIHRLQPTDISTCNSGRVNSKRLSAYGTTKFFQETRNHYDTPYCLRHSSKNTSPNSLSLLFTIPRSWSRRSLLMVGL